MTTNQTTSVMPLRPAARRWWRTVLLGGSMLAVAAAAQAQDIAFNIPAQSVGAALATYARQAGVQVLFPYDGLGARKSRPLVGTYDKARALAMLLDGTGLEAVPSDNGILTLRQRAPTALRADRGDPAARVELVALGAPATAVDEPAQVGASPSTPSVGAAAAGLETAAADVDETIVVTGTLIRGIAPESSPIQIYTQADIQQAGVASVEDFIDRLPQNFGGGPSAEATGLANDRAAGFNLASGTGVNLRGLGSGSTLVLLNGRRLAPSGNLGDFVDVSVIPVSALARVEVVTDGASAIYGADAIGGVVNFRLRDDFEGLETFARYGAVTNGSLDEYRAGATAGTAWASGSAMISYDYAQRDNLSAAERGFSSGVPLPNDLLPEQERHSVIINWSQDLGDLALLRGHGVYGRRDVFRTTTTTPGPRTLITDAESEQYGVSGTAEFKLGSDWSAALSGDYFDVSEFYARVGPGASSVENRSDLWTADVLLDGTVLRLPGGSAKAAIGASYREETFTSYNLTARRLSAADERNVTAAYAELFIPLVGPANDVRGIRRLELSLAGRYEDYSRFGDTFNPKVGLVWVPAMGLKFRGSYGTSVNAPNLADLGSSLGAASIFVLPDPQSPTGTSITLLDNRSNPDLRPEEATTWSAGFEAERELGRGQATLSATYYAVDYEGRIASPGGTAATYLSNPAFASVVTRDPPLDVISSIITDARAALGVFNLTGGRWRAPGDEDVLFDARLRNQAADVTRGIDLRLNYTFKLDAGTLGASLDGNHVLTYKRQITPTSLIADVANTVFYPADLRLRGGLSGAGSRLSAAAFVNHVGSYVDNRPTPTVPIDAWTTVDLSVVYDTGERAGTTLLDNLRLSLSVLNLFDTAPPSIALDPLGGVFGYDPTNAGPLGRFVALQITKRW